MSLLDNINQQMQGQTAPTEQAGQALGAGQSLRSLLRAKTGKAGQAGTGAGPSSLQEKTAARQAQLGQQQLAQQGQLMGAQQAEQSADIAQRTQQQAAQQDQARQDILAQADRQTQNILNDFAQGTKRLDNAQDISDLEQVGFVARLQNQQYISQLQDVGKRNRLDSDVGFKTEIAKQAMADNQDLLNDKLAFETIMNASDRDFQKALSNIDINYAMQIANDAAKAANAQQIAKGVGTAVTAGAKAYASDAFQTKE